MDYQILAIIVLSAMLIASWVRNIFLEKELRRLKDADIIDDITYDEYDYEEEEEEEGQCEILYL